MKRFEVNSSQAYPLQRGNISRPREEEGSNSFCRYFKGFQKDEGTFRELLEAVLTTSTAAKASQPASMHHSHMFIFKHCWCPLCPAQLKSKQEWSYPVMKISKQADTVRTGKICRLNNISCRRQLICFQRLGLVAIPAEEPLRQQWQPSPSQTTKLSSNSPLLKPVRLIDTTLSLLLVGSNS